MVDSIAAQSDLLIYLVPGYLVLLAILFAHSPSVLRLDEKRLGAGAVLASVIVAMLLGVALHRVSASLLVINRIVYQEPALTGIVRRFEHLPRVQAAVAKHLSFNPRDAVDAYYYGKLLVDEKMPRSGEDANRLMSMALLCRNMLVAIPIAFAALARRKTTHGEARSARLTFSLGLGAVVFEFLFLKGFLAYWSASVWRVLRATALLP